MLFVEADADEYAAKALLPEDFDLHLREQLSSSDILDYAIKKAVHPAIVAGRIQHKRKDFRTFAQVLGRGEVRKLFARNARK